MEWFHLIFGLVLFAVFAATGSHMRADFPDKEAIGQDLRILMRSRHIYILFSALIHLALGVYLQMRNQTWQKTAQCFGSFLLTLSSVLLVWAFVVETYQFQNFSNVSRWGIYTALGGIVFHLVGGIHRQRTANTSS